MGKGAINPLDAMRFVFMEVHRFHSLIRTGLGTISQDDALYSLQRPGGGCYICGKAAALRLQELAELVRSRAGLARRIELHTVLDPLSKLVVERFFIERRKIDDRQVQRVLSLVGKSARQACVDRTHFVPCHLMSAKDPDIFSIGPIRFLNRRTFCREILEKVRGYPRAKDPSRGWTGRDLLPDALRYYRTFGWVAEVTVKGCDPATSCEIAHQAVISAVDCMHLVFGAQHTDKLRVRGPAMRGDRRASLWLTPEGHLKPSLSSDFIGEGSFPDGWSAWLLEPQTSHLLELFGIALESIVDPDHVRPLSQRALDAAQWFGEASRDESAPTRVVKYVTALERMVMTDQKSNIAETLAERVSALCLRGPTPSDRDEWRLKTKQLYTLRSELVHGALSPRDPKVKRGVWLGATLGELCLLQGLAAFGEKGLKTDAFPSRKIDTWFEDFFERVATIERPVSVT